jgi:cellulose synthase/poly-beta-1,6-N-acetylglucosamine synthase-like glycosyltransferase
VQIKIVGREQNSGSTFRQWIKGLKMASGDLVWIAESDDCAHHLFLERLVAEFYDPYVVLAYCQSALVGPNHELLAENFLGHTDDISSTRWRRRYSAKGPDEVERALSQKNTIPNASAVVFRRPTQLDFADDLASLRFAGDWLFYAMLLRKGKITYLPEVLNFYRRHQETVTRKSALQDTQPHESLYVKARLFETFRVSPRAIASSMAQTVVEYNGLRKRSNRKRPALSANPQLAGVLARIRVELDRSRGATASRKVLLVVDASKPGEDATSAIQLARALAAEHTVFVCSAQAWGDAATTVACALDQIILIEGTQGMGPPPGPPWRPEENIGAEIAARSDALKELIKFHQIEVIHSQTWSADQLVLSMIGDLRIAWFIHLDGVLDGISSGSDAPALSGRAAAAILNAATGIFYSQECDFTRLGPLASLVRNDQKRWLIDPESAFDRITAACDDSLDACAFDRVSASSRTIEDAVDSS